MIDREPGARGAAPDYTTAALTSLFVVVLMVLWTVWAWAGFVTALALGWLAERGLARLSPRAPGD